MYVSFLFTAMSLLPPVSLISPNTKFAIKKKHQKMSKVERPQTSYLVPLDAWQRGPAM